jgi:monoamine oxidase
MLGLPQVGALSKPSDALGALWDGLYWAGTERATQWFGYMGGAIGAGYRAAQAVLDSAA